MGRGKISAARRLEEFNRVARRVVDHNLGPAGSCYDRVPEPQAGRAEPSDLGGDVVYHELNPIPPAWSRLAAVGHRSSPRTGRAAAEEPKVPGQHSGDGRGCVGEESE